MIYLFLFFVWRKCGNVFCEKPKVSVIVPVYNMESKISICLSSITKQTLKEIEIICVDDGSQDRSFLFLKEYAEKDERIVVIYQENCGPACARNKGIFLANGEYLGFVDSDDWVESTLFETAYETAKSGGVDVVEFGIFGPKYLEKLSKEKTLRGTKAARNFIPLQGKPVIWSRIYKSSLIKGSGITFDTTVVFGQEDVIFNMDLIPFVKSVSFVNTRFYHYNILESGLSKNYQSKHWKSLGDVGLLHLNKISHCQKCLGRDDFESMREFFSRLSKLKENNLWKIIRGGTKKIKKYRIRNRK